MVLPLITTPVIATEGSGHFSASIRDRRISRQDFLSFLLFTNSQACKPFCVSSRENATCSTQWERLSKTEAGFDTEPVPGLYSVSESISQALGSFVSSAFAMTTCCLHASCIFLETFSQYETSDFLFASSILTESTQSIFHFSSVKTSQDWSSFFSNEKREIMFMTQSDSRSQAQAPISDFALASSFMPGI